MDDAVRKFMTEIDRKAMKLLLDELECPPDIEKFFDCLVKNGCPGISVIQGIIEFSQYLKEKKDEIGFEVTAEQFAELLRGTNIKLQEDDENE